MLRCQGASAAYKPKFHLACHVTSRHDTTRIYHVSSRACSNMADDEEAVVLACTSLVFSAPDLHQSQEQLLEKSEVDMSTPVHAVATPLDTCRASRACRDERVALVVRVAPCLFQHGGRRSSSSARLYKFSLFCSGFASISGTTSGKE